MAKQTSVYDAEIANKMKEIRRRKIWQRARAVLEKFGHNHVSERSCYMIHNGHFGRSFPEGELEISIASHGQFHENLELEIKIQGQLVFKAEDSAWHEKYDSRRVMKLKSDYIVIDKFVSGDWINLLNVKKLENVLKSNTKKISKRTAKPEKSRENDEQLAQRFGVWDPAG